MLEALFLQSEICAVNCSRLSNNKDRSGVAQRLFSGLTRRSADLYFSKQFLRMDELIRMRAGVTDEACHGLFTRKRLPVRGSTSRWRVGQPLPIFLADSVCATALCYCRNASVSHHVSPLGSPIPFRSSEKGGHASLSVGFHSFAADC